MPGAHPPAREGEPSRPIRIAVIDSGVNPRHPHIDALVAGGAAITPDGAIRLDPEAWLDRIGHGTAVMAAIQEHAPAAEYFAVKVFHDSLRTSAATLLRAIDWCVDQHMDVVNLSLGTTNAHHHEAFAEAAERAMVAGALLVAARDAHGEPCYPGCLPSVISVGIDPGCPRDSYRCEASGDETIFYASGYPRPVPGVPPTRNLSGISFAVANMTGFVALACATAGDADGGRAGRVRAVLRAR